MGKMDSAFGGGFSGKLGNVVGYEWRGKACVRSLPHDFHDAKTPMQLEQRSLFKQTVAFASRAKDVLHLGFGDLGHIVENGDHVRFISMQI